MSKIAVYTLIDITATDVKTNAEDTVFRRNQQRNWETAHQIINLRTKVDVEIKPYTPKIVSLANHKFSNLYYGEHKCWKFIFTVEFSKVFAGEVHILEKLEYDFNQVPIITGLEETINLPDPVFYTKGGLINTYFKVL